MDAIKKQRRVVRTSFTRTYNSLQTMLATDPVVPLPAKVALAVLEEKMLELNGFNTRIMSLLQAAEEFDENAILAEMEGADEYTTKYHQAKLQVEALERAQRTLPLPNHVDGNETLQQLNETLGHLTLRENKQYNLPKVDLYKFSGEVKEWLQFWSLFKNIHEDATLSTERKFHYLIQSMVEGSRASDVVKSYPPTPENYSKAVEALKNRFGKDELIIEVYVRELLRLVLNNSMKPDQKTTLASLYDKLEAHLRALDSLGVTSTMYAAMLYPLVESSLPEELLRAWQRHHATLKVNNAKERLDKLMGFLQAEVESEERIAMAVSGFGIYKEQTKDSKEKKKKPRPEANAVSTASGLLSVKDVKKTPCVFCEETHDSSTCDKARKMTLEERQKAARLKNACFNCLLMGHGYKTCRYKGKCGWCSRRHVLLMCRDVSSASTSPSPPTQPKEIVEQNLANVVTNNEVFLQTLQVRVMSQGKEHVVRAVIDSGSHHSYVTSNLAAKLGCEVIGTQTMVHLLFGGGKSAPQNHKCYRLHVRSMDDTYACNFAAYQQDVICQGLVKTNPGPWMEDLKKEGIVLSDTGVGDQPISILFGADITGKLYTGKLLNLPSGPTAIQTHLGWTLMGKNGLYKQQHEDSTLIAISMFVQDAMLSDLWKLDVLGIEDPIQKKSMSTHQQEVLENFRDTIEINDAGRYQVLLPWKENHPPLDENRDIAERCLENTLKKLQGQHLVDDYDKIFEDWLSAGIIEEVPQHEVNNKGHYLPHRPVIKENSTTPIRPVFNASAKRGNQPSLNQCLEPGPNLIERIPRLLHRFRVGKIGIIADIKRAFLQISIAPRDRDSLRFFWKKLSNAVVRIFRHCRVVFGVTCSPFQLGATIDLHIERVIAREKQEYLRQLLEKLKSSFYVDNSVTSARDEKEAREFRELASAVMAEGGFDLRGWEQSGEKNVNEGTPVLGLLWDKEKDVLRLPKETLTQSSPVTITKRVILSATQRIFDPLGLVCPITLCTKVLLQKLWCQEVGWDSPLEGHVKKSFMQWQRDLTHLERVQIPRWAYGDDDSSVTLHLFTDASKDAYAAVVFARVETNSEVQLYFLEAKSRVAPKDKTTIPRLELMAATVGVRLLNSIIESLDLNTRHRLRKYCWTDSTTVLSWIQRESQWATFVWNRIQEIRVLTHATEWRHVPGEMNPADLPSRGCTAVQLVESKWWKGPDWLKGPPDTWPNVKYSINEEEISHELKRSASRVVKPQTTLLVDNTMSNVEEVKDGQPFHQLLQRVSRYPIILRAVASVQRFIFNSRHPPAVRRSGQLTQKEVEVAELLLTRRVQKENFEAKDDPKLATMNVYEDKAGLLRLKSLMENRRDTEEFRHPIVLDHRHILVTRLIEHMHRKLCHVQTDTIMSALRERYWILSCRRAVNRVVRRCGICKRHLAKRLEAPFAALPENRVRAANTFEVTGIDYAGPLYLQGGSKVWICLFTCAVYRAIHLELVTALSTHVFMEAFRRFVARRGRPSVVYTDNGTNFVGACKILQMINWQKVAEYGTVDKIEWHFNPPSAAWWGGWWERLVRSVKEILRKILRKSLLNYEELSTVLCDCERVINSRPLTYLAEDPEQLTPLTPVRFLGDVPSGGVADLDACDAGALNRRVRYLQQLRDHLRGRFRSEYLGQLSRKFIDHQKKPAVKVGDIVLIGNDQQKRLDWILGKVIRTFPGRDGETRVVRLKTQKGELERPVQRLYPLELDSNAEAEVWDELQSQTQSAKVSPPVRHDTSSPSNDDPARRSSNRDQSPTVDQENGEETFVAKTDGIEKKTRRGRVVKPPTRYLD